MFLWNTGTRLPHNTMSRPKRTAVRFRTPSQTSLHAHCTASCQLGWEHFGQRELRKEWTEQTSDCTEKYGTGGDLGVRNTSEDCYYHSEINVTKKRNEWNGTKMRIGSKRIYHLRTDTKHYLYICLVHTAVPTDTAKQIQTTSCNPVTLMNTYQ